MSALSVTLPLAELLIQRRSELDRYRILVDICPLPMFVRDSKGNQIMTNQAYLNMVDRTKDAVTGLGWMDALLPTERSKVVATWEACAGSDTNFEYTNHYVRPNGDIIEAHVVATRLPGNVYAGFCKPARCGNVDGACGSFSVKVDFPKAT